MRVKLVGSDDLSELQKAINEVLDCADDDGFAGTDVEVNAGISPAYIATIIMEHPDEYPELASHPPCVMHGLQGSGYPKVETCTDRMEHGGIMGEGPVAGKLYANSNVPKPPISYIAHDGKINNLSLRKLSEWWQRRKDGK